MLLTVFSSRRQSAGPSVFVLPAHLQHQVNGVGAALNDCDSQFTVNLDTFYFSIKLHYFCRQQDSHSLSSIWSRGKHRVFYFTLPSSESLLLHRFFFFFLKEHLLKVLHIIVKLDVIVLLQDQKH